MGKPKTVQLERDYDKWMDLCKWLEINFFGYDGDKQKLHTSACIALDGLRKGQMMQDIIFPANGSYPVEVLLMTFQLHKEKILYAIKGKEFKNECSKMVYICAIAREYINDVYSRYLEVQKTQEKIENIDTSIFEHEGAEYQSSSKTRKDNAKFEGLW